MSSFVREFLNRKIGVQEQKSIIRRFFNFVNRKIEHHPLWTNSTSEDKDNAIEGMEKLITSKLYDAIFCSQDSDDFEKDKVLSRKISLYCWIEPVHLDIKVSASGNSIEAACSELKRLNDFKAPKDKLICILNCCKIIYGIITEEGSADDFLPLLIFIIIKSDTENLYTNVQYIYNYRNPSKLESESSYYLTNILAAASFVEKLDKTFLSITDEEFEQHMTASIETVTKTVVAISESESQILETKMISPNPKSPALKILEKPIQFFQRIFSDDEISSSHQGSSNDLNKTVTKFEKELSEEEKNILNDYDLQLALALSLSESVQTEVPEDVPLSSSTVEEPKLSLLDEPNEDIEIKPL